jgi:hypothetical protein
MSICRILCVGLALFCGLSSEAGVAMARSDGAYLDILSAEAVGHFRPQTYDVYRRSTDEDVFVGNQTLGPHSFLGGGLGLRVVYATKHGLRFSGEGSFAAGRIRGADLPFLATATALRGEFLGGLGYQVAAGPLVLHGATILGLDFMSFKAAQPIAPAGALQAAPAAFSATGEPIDYKLERYGLRLGAQLGVHLQVTKPLALYSDVTFDYDGQWRARFGFTIGRIKN